MMKVKRFLRRYPREKKMRLIGPNCAGIISPGKGFMGIMPPHIYMPGRVGIVGRSGTLGYEAASQMKALGIGVSSSIGIGGDPINGSSFRDILELFENDPETDAVMMIGEIGGPQEAEAARICPRSHDQAGGGLCGGPVGAQGPQDGPCGRDHLGLRRKRAGKGRDPAGGRDHGRAQPVDDGRDGGAHPKYEGSSMSRVEHFPMVDMKRAEDWVGRTEEPGAADAATGGHAEGRRGASEVD
jgi:hypothetical protein